MFLGSSLGTRIAITTLMLLPLIWLLGCTQLNSPAAADASMRVQYLRCEYLVDPLGIDEIHPRLSWELEDGRRGAGQTAYHILVSSSPDLLRKDNGDLWDTGKVKTDQSFHVGYAGRPLTSGQRCWWKVRVWDHASRPSEWSAPAFWSMGLLNEADWQGKWIGAEAPVKPVSTEDVFNGAQWIWAPGEQPASVKAPPGPCYFRRALTLPADRNISKVECLMTADDEFYLYVNGHALSGYATFNQAKRLDIASFLQKGENILAVAGRNGGGEPNPAGFIGRVRIEFTEGEPIEIHTDTEWRASYEGPSGWEKPEFDDQNWSAAQLLGGNGMAPWGLVSDATDDRGLAARMLRREFQVSKPVKHATAYVCGLGVFELYLNGQRVSDHVLQPALSEYDRRAYYITFDMTNLLQPGDNAVGVMLGNGRYWAPRTKVPVPTRDYGVPRLLLQMNIIYQDGTSETVVSDASWKVTTTGPIQANNEYDGEIYDARMEMDRWNQVGFNDREWSPAQVLEAPKGRLRTQMIDPMRVTETIQPVAVRELRPGVHIFDMGQNMVGWCRIRVSGSAGTKITLRHAETVQPDGSLYTENLRSARAEDVYILRGEGTETYEPRFVFHGFRFVEVIGWPGKPDRSCLEGRVVHDNLAVVGDFHCSSEIINRLYRNIVWGMRGNYRSVPTDCPQRDERQGWLGDRSEESRGESYIFDTFKFYGKWITDMADAQSEKGEIPDVAPPFWPMYSNNVTWPSSFIIIPGMIHDQFADLRVLETHYASMKKWIDFMSGFIQDGLMPRDTYGDWCVPPELPELIHSRDPMRQTKGILIATAYFCHDLRLMARYARLLGKTDDAGDFEARAAKMKEAFHGAFYRAQEHQYDNGSMTSSVLALALDLAPSADRTKIFDRLIDKLLVEHKGHIGTGLIGCQWLMRTLTRNGRPDVALQLAQNRTYPSWGYMLEKDATTIWELWNGDTANPAMNSHNHVMLIGDLLTWCYEDLAGIRPDPERPGFKHVIMKPQPVGDLSFVQARLRTISGRVASRWRVEGGTFYWEIEIPPGASATIYVPTADPTTVQESGRPTEQAEGVTLLRIEPGRAVFSIQSGKYRFVSKKSE